MKHFNKVPWMDGANIYEVNIRQYTEEGTFAAFTKHLPRLKDMGVKILWLMPVTPISLKERQGALGSYYACSSYTAVNPEFGTDDDFRKLIEAAHNNGMKLIIDWVANHTGCDHEWTLQHADWYAKDVHGNFMERNGWHDVIDLNFEVQEMRMALIKAMQYWIKEFNIDGFRCDMAHLVPLDFWLEAREQCDAVKTLFWLAECEVPEYHEAFDVSYAWEWMHVSEKLAKQVASLQHLREVFNKYSNYLPGAQKLYFTSNHDENSWNGTEYEKYGPAAKAFAVCTCTWPGMPLLYSGQELPNLKRLKFFDKDQINWKPEVALHDFYKALLQLKTSNAAMHSGAGLLVLHTGEDYNILAYLLTKDASKVLVLLNLSPNDKIQFTVSNHKLEGAYYNLFSGLQYTLNSNQHFELQAWEYAVYVAAS